MLKKGTETESIDTTSILRTLGMKDSQTPKTQGELELSGCSAVSVMGVFVLVTLAFLECRFLSSYFQYFIMSLVSLAHWYKNFASSVWTFCCIVLIIKNKENTWGKDIKHILWEAQT